MHIKRDGFGGNMISDVLRDSPQLWEDFKQNTLNIYE